MTSLAFLGFHVFLALSEAKTCLLFRSLPLGRGYYWISPEEMAKLLLLTGLNNSDNDNFELLLRGIMPRQARLDAPETTSRLQVDRVRRAEAIKMMITVKQ